MLTAVDGHMLRHNPQRRISNCGQRVAPSVLRRNITFPEGIAVVAAAVAAAVAVGVVL